MTPPPPTVHQHRPCRGRRLIQRPKLSASVAGVIGVFATAAALPSAPSCSIRRASTDTESAYSVCPWAARRPSSHPPPTRHPRRRRRRRDPPHRRRQGRLPAQWCAQRDPARYGRLTYAVADLLTSAPPPGTLRSNRPRIRYVLSAHRRRRGRRRAGGRHLPEFGRAGPGAALDGPGRIPHPRTRHRTRRLGGPRHRASRPNARGQGPLGA